MSKIVRTIAKQLIIMILVFGLYVIMHGHDLPGGGFQGGAIITSGVAMVLVVFGAVKITRSIRIEALQTAACYGALLFLIIALAGIGTSFFHNFLLGTAIFGDVPAAGSTTGHVWSGGIIPPMELTVGVIVTAGLSAALIAMALFANHADKEEKEE